MEKIKTKNEILREMQIIADDVLKKKEEVELQLKLIEELELKYFLLAEEIKKN